MTYRAACLDEVCLYWASSGPQSSVDFAHGEAAHLTAAIDRNGRFSGYYKCSLCDSEFRPNPKNPGEIGATFAAHVRFSHRADNRPAVAGQKN